MQSAGRSPLDGGLAEEFSWNQEPSSATSGIGERTTIVCFSPEVDLVAGLVIGAVGIDGVRHVRRPAERAIAVLPLVFAGHQLIEAFAWWGLQGKVPEQVGQAAVWLYLVIAFGVVPILVPMAVWSLSLIHI